MVRPLTLIETSQTKINKIDWEKMDFGNPNDQTDKKYIEFHLIW